MRLFLYLKRDPEILIYLFVRFLCIEMTEDGLSIGRNIVARYTLNQNEPVLFQAEAVQFL